MDNLNVLPNPVRVKSTFGKDEGLTPLDGDWVELDHDSNGNGVPDVGETNVDEEDEGRIQQKSLSLFPIIPSMGITIYF